MLALGLLPGVLSAAVPTQANEVIETVNSLRAQGCGNQPVRAPALRSATRLGAAAAKLADGRKLAGALADAGYVATTATSIHVRLGRTEDDPEAVLRSRFCDRLADADFTEIGVAQRATETWIILAAPFTPPSPEQAPKVQERVIELVNAARAVARRCGRKRFDAAPGLVRSAPLERAALAHARDLAARRALGHRGSDGSEPAERVARAGYVWAAVAENVAAGLMTAQDVVEGWLASPSHCANIMNPRFKDMGVAFALADGERGGIYWAQVLGAQPELP
jgi:uncharacterized protein YkwD